MSSRLYFSLAAKLSQGTGKSTEQLASYAYGSCTMTLGLSIIYVQNQKLRMEKQAKNHMHPKVVCDCLI